MIKIGSRVVDSQGHIGTVTGFRQHQYLEVQEASVSFDDPQASGFYSHRVVKTLRELNEKEPLDAVLNELYSTTAQKLEDARHSGNDHGQYVFSAQLDALRMIAARVLNTTLKS